MKDPTARCAPNRAKDVLAFEVSESHSMITPGQVVAEIGKHVLVDGFQIVVDLEKSSGCRMVDAVSGRSFLDLYSFFASMPVGFNHPYFQEAPVRKSLEEAARIKVANSDVYSIPYAEFVSTLSRVAGLPPLKRYFFIDGGALAVENALKSAMDWKVRKNLQSGCGERGTEILHFRSAFHGRSGYTLSLTNTDPRKTDYFAKFQWPRVSNPYIDFTCSEPIRGQRVIEREAEVERDIRSILARRGRDIAALIIEPIQGEGGDNHFRGEWLRTLRRICDETDVLLIFDEVQTGLGITGRTWCCQHFDVVPDLLVFGKKTQVCGVMAGPRLDEVEENCFRLPGRINSTWGGNLCDMVRSTRYLEIIEKERLVENAARVGGEFLEAMEALSREEPVLSGVRGRGLMIAFDLPDRETREQFYLELYRSGLLAIRSGTKSIRFRPVLDFPRSAVTEAIGLICEACRRLRAGKSNVRRNAA